MKNEKLSFLEPNKAVLVNFTGSSYHWGCYGTSMEIYHSLLEKNYFVQTLDVSVTHSVTPTIENLSDFDDREFFNRFVKLNTSLVISLNESDVVVVNGEGSLHRLGKGSLNLLYIMYICKKYLNKKVHLINFSCFPNGDATLPKDRTIIYPRVLKFLDKIATRDIVSNGILSQSGVKTTQSFDCLPRFLARYGEENSHVPNGNILVTGGAKFDGNRYEVMVDFISHFLKKNVQVTFLSGAQFSPAAEDISLQKKLQENPRLSNLNVVQAQSMRQWIDEFKSASFLFSARFHHSISALSIGTPFRYFDSNTPKINAILETIDEDVNDFYVKDNDIDTLINSAEKCLDHSASIKSKKRLKTMISLANENFIGL
ncbi:polysaccharide pyruvyl transferase family protein [Hyphomicrobiales bacterium]|jgi:polysaccharide pyruvyl transferase WcaK-like protein|nr:polysaccharide pyruvyl transferase family protein [Hyphomicrobiales bacterium]MDC3272253.1 polysaccharide pyruvyl transferase family protein [Hyphomicrobiales bacterium]